MQFFKLQAVLSGGASARSTHFRFSVAFLGHFFMFPTCWAKRLAGLFVCLPFPLLLGWGCQALKQGAQLPGGGGVLSLEGVAVNAEGVHALGVTRAVLDAVDPLKPVPQDGEDLPVSEEESPRRYPPPSPGTPPASGRSCGIAGGWCPAAAGTPGRRSAGFQSRTPRRFG